MREQEPDKGIVQYQSDYAGVSAEFVRRFNRILLSKDTREAMANAIDALWEGVPCHTISVSARNDDGTFTMSMDAEATAASFTAYIQAL